MKLKSKICLKFIALVCIVTHMFILVQTQLFAVSENDDDEITNIEQPESAAELMSNTSGVGASNLSFSIIEPEIPYPRTTCVMFDPTDVISCSYISEGLQVV